MEELFFNKIMHIMSVLRVDTRTNMKERSKQGVRLQYNGNVTAVARW